MRTKYLLAVFVLFVLIAVSVTPYLGAHFVVLFAERAIGKPIEGTVKPDWFKTSFRLKNASFDWENDFSLMGSDIFVDYDIRDLMSFRSLRLSLTGSNVKIQLMGDLFKSFGINHETVRNFNAVFVIDRDGLKDIEKLHIDSDKIKFEIKENL